MNKTIGFVQERLNMSDYPALMNTEDVRLVKNEELEEELLGT